MCYGCKPFCENCKPKFVFCSQCGFKNFLFSNSCTSCGAELPEEAKEKAREEWAEAHDRARKSKG